MTANMIDDNGRKVLTFEGKIVNLSRVAELTDAVIDMAESGAWRKYQLATGPETWRAAEFDYFLIAQGMHAEDARRVLKWNQRAKALVPLMDVDAESRQRRTLERAAAEWGRLNINLVERARELGWVSKTKDTITPARQPIPKRSRDPKWAERAKHWHVNWSDDRTPAQAIVDKLLKDDVLARDVYKRLDTFRKTQANRSRSEAPKRSISRRGNSA